ncbi:hypothetical protein [Candidatus Vidania fulgoroideorum]
MKFIPINNFIIIKLIKKKSKIILYKEKKTNLGKIIFLPKKIKNIKKGDKIIFKNKSIKRLNFSKKYLYLNYNNIICIVKNE